MLRIKRDYSAGQREGHSSQAAFWLVKKNIEECLEGLNCNLALARMSKMNHSVCLIT